MIRIVIADDHDIVREGLKQIVSEAEDIAVAGEARTAEETIALVRRGGFDVLILDLNLPDRSGLEALPQIRAIAPDIAVLILSMHQQASYASRAMQNGASGYVSKDTARQHLVTAIHKVARGERFLTPGLAESLAFELMQDRGTRQHERLSAREFQVLCMIAGGKPPRAIAAELNVSVKTVATHRARILEKMQLKNNAQIVQYAMEHHLLPDR